MFYIRFSFKQIFLLQTFFIVFATSLFVVWSLYASLNFFQKHTILSLKEKITTPYSILEKYYQEEQAGHLTRGEAQEKAAKEIEILRWGHDRKNYFWINTNSPHNIKMVMHPYKPQLNGKDITMVKDKKGVRLFYEMVKMCQTPERGGFVRYYWQYKDQKDRIESKISYVKLFEPWGWIVGTGVYDVDLKKQAWEDIKPFLKGTLIFGVILCFVLFLVSFLVVRNFDSSAKKIVVRLKGVATGEADLTKSLTIRKINCSSTRQCNKFDCPCYGKEGYCWYEVGSFAYKILCPQILSEKVQSCEQCKIYKKAIRNEFDEISTFVNAFLARIRALIVQIKEQGQIVHFESVDMYANAEKMVEAGEMSKHEAIKIKETIKKTDMDVESVAAAMEEMTATVSEIGRHTIHANEIAQTALNEAEGAKEAINLLTESSSRISEISQLIGNIAEQTNLLALNATIEAARAGEAGKGFAVVANEVKELARQTGNSVEEIESMVNELQTGTHNTQTIIEKMTETIRQVAELSNNIAAAIEQQSVTINEISNSAQTIKKEIKEIANKGTRIADVSQVVSNNALDIRQAAEGLKSLSFKLSELLKAFKV